MTSDRLSYTIALTCISRGLFVRDRLFKRVPRSFRESVPGVVALRGSIDSAGNRIDTVLVRHAAVPARAALLICHGIGETVDRWFAVQQLLAANGIASLVFDYSGYGSSSGTVDWSQSEQDAVAAFEHLRSLTGNLPASILGFSLGSGIAAAVIDRVDADLLVLCAAFTSFRSGAHAVGIPKALSRLVPPIWRTQESLRSCPTPVLVVHGEKDGLFPVQMARDLVSACAAEAELLVAADVGHNEPFRRPVLSYWGPIIDRLIAATSDRRRDWRHSDTRLQELNWQTELA